MKNYYEILGVNKNATQDEIREAYYKKAKQYHPDHHPGDKSAEENFKEVAEAYETLGDAEKRKQYDEERVTVEGSSAEGETNTEDMPEGEPETFTTGEFYYVNPKGKVFIDDAKLVDFIESKGWRWIKTAGVKTLVRMIGNIVEESEPAAVTSFMRNYIKSVIPYYIGNGATRDHLLARLIANSKNLFDKVRFDFLKTVDLNFVEDTMDISYIFYMNNVVKITASSVEPIPYNAIGGTVWRNDIVQKDFRLEQLKPLESIIEQFLFNVCGQDKSRYRSLVSLIGYMLHRYKDPANAFAVILVDEKVGETGDANGRTGKGIVSDIFEHIRNTMVIPGKTFTMRRSFALQRLKPGTSILVIEDISIGENFENYYNLVTDGIATEQKYKGEVYLSFAESPKIFITTNNVMKAPIGASTEGRKKEFEISDRYSPKYTPKDEFGHRLFLDWDEAEWNRFHNFVAKSLRFYLKFGVIDPPEINLAERRIMQDVGEELVEMLDSMLMNGDTKFHKKRIHEAFIKAYPDLRVYYRSPNKITKKMKMYFVHRSIKFYEYPANTKDYIVIDFKGHTSMAGGTAGGTKESDRSIEQQNTKPIKTIKNVAHKYTAANTPTKRKYVVEELKKQTCFAFDTETTGLDVNGLEIVGLSVAWKPYEAWYIPMPRDEKEIFDVLKEFAPVFANEDVEMAAHNSKFDIQVLKKYGIEVKGKVFDSMLASYLCNPDGKNHGLKPVTLEMLNYKHIEYEEMIHKYGKMTSIREVPLADITEYAGEDADYTLQLKPLLEKELNDRGLMQLFREVEVPLAVVLGDMEKEGIRVDDAMLRELNLKAVIELKQKAKEIYTAVGEEFNISSPRQLSRILFDKLGLKSEGEKNAQGAYSTSEDALDKLKDSSSVVRMVLRYKKLATLSRTFLEKLPEQVNPFTGRVHTNFNQVVTSTGRLSSSKPNLQNIPKGKKNYGDEIRKAFLPRDENHVIVAADYSQVELRIAAHFSSDENLISAYRRGDDIHTLTAAKVFNKPAEEIDKEGPERKVAKAVSFGLIYGMSAFTLAERLTKETGKQVTEERAKEIVESYFNTYPGIKKYSEEAIYSAVTKGYAETLLHRKRYLPDVKSFDSSTRHAAERNAVNTPIQGTSADIIKVAMINIHREIKERGLKTRIALQIHDELLLDVPKDELDIVIPLIRDKMENAVTLNVPLAVEIKHGANWYEAH